MKKKGPTKVQKRKSFGHIKVIKSFKDFLFLQSSTRTLIRPCFLRHCAPYAICSIERRSYFLFHWKALFHVRLDPWASYVLPTPENVYVHHFWNPPQDQVQGILVIRHFCLMSLLNYPLHFVIRHKKRLSRGISDGCWIFFQYSSLFIGPRHVNSRYTQIWLEPIATDIENCLYLTEIIIA